MAEIDFDLIKREGALDTSPEAEFRFNATCKRMMNMPTTAEEDAALAAWSKKMGWDKRRA